MERDRIVRESETVSCFYRDTICTELSDENKNKNKSNDDDDGDNVKQLRRGLIF